MTKIKQENKIFDMSMNRKDLEMKLVQYGDEIEYYIEQEKIMSGIELRNEDEVVNIT